MNSPTSDLDRLGSPSNVDQAKQDGGASPSGRSAAALEQELEGLKRKVLAHDAERMLFVLFVVIVWNAHVFPGFNSWAPAIAILVLQLIGLFILAYRLDMGEVIKLFWGTLTAYSGQRPNAGQQDDPK